MIKFIKSPVFIGIGLTLSMSGVLYMTKYQVKEVEKSLSKINRAIYKKEESIHILKAELAYRKSPYHVRELITQKEGFDPYLDSKRFSEAVLSKIPYLAAEGG